MARRNGLALLGLLVVATLGLVLVTPARATEYSWIGGDVGGNLWDIGANWNPATAYPVAGDTATFDAGGEANNLVDLGASGARAVDFIVLQGATASYTIGSTADSTLTINQKVTQDGTNSVISCKVATGAVNDLQLDALSGTLTLSGALSGDKGITKTGTGTVILSGANSYAGGTTISAGTVSIQNATALGSAGLITFAGPSTLQWNGITTDLSSRLKIDDGVIATIDTMASNVTFATGLQVGAAKTGGLTKTGTGTLILGAANTYTGPTTIEAGTLQVNALANLAGASAVTLGSSGTLNLNANNTTWTNTVTGSGTLKVKGGTGANTSYTGDITGLTGVLDIIGSGKVQIDTAARLPNPSALIKIESTGTLFINLASANVPNNIQMYGGATGEAFGQLRVEGDATVSGQITLMANATMGTNSGTGTFGDILESGGARNLTKQGAGISILTGTNAYTGTTAISGGTLRTQTPLPAGRPVTMANGTTLDLYGTSPTVSNLTGGNATTVITDSNTTPGADTLTITLQTGAFAGKVLDGPNRTIALRVANNNTNPNVTSNLNNTFSGGLTLLHNGTNGTRLTLLTGAVGAPGAIVNGPYGTGPITIGLAPTDRAGIWFNTADTILMNDLIVNTTLGSDRGAIRVDNAGHIMSGALQLNLADARFATNGTGVITLTGPVSSIGPSPTGLLVDSAWGTSITVILDNQTGTPNSYTGATTIGARGTLRANSGGTGLPATSNLVLAGGVLEGKGADTFTRTLGTGADQVQWSSTAGGGFSANGGKLTVTLGGGTMSNVVGATTGLLAGTASGNGNWTAANPGDLGVKPDPELGFSSAKPPWADNITYIYTGQYWSDGGIDKWCTDIDDGGYVKVNGVVVCNKNNNGYTSGSTVGLGDAGWKNIEIRVSNGTGGAGATRGAPGVGVDFAGTATVKADFTEANATNVQYREFTLLLEPGSDPLGLGTLVWGYTPGFVAGGQSLVFGSATASDETELRNPINLNYGTQTVQVNAGTGGDFANLSGALSNGSLTKAGAGRLVLSAANTGLTGTTTISAGTLELQHASALVASPVVLTGTGVLDLNVAGCQLVSVTAVSTSTVNLNVAGSLATDLSFAGGQVNYNVDNAGGNHTVTIAGTDLQTNLGTLTVVSTVTTLGGDVLAVNGGNLLVINSPTPAVLSLDRTTNLDLKTGAILWEPVPGGAIAATIANLGTDNAIIRGLGADMSDNITVATSGGGTPYQGLSSDLAANRRLSTGTITVDTAAGSTGAVLQGINNRTLTLGNGTTLGCVTIMPNTDDTTATITTYGKVSLDDNAAVFGDSAANKAVEFRVANGSTLFLSQNTAMGSGTGVAGIVVESGGILDPANVVGAAMMNGPVSLLSGGILLLNDVSGHLNGAGTITQEAGAITRIATNANALTSLSAGVELAPQSLGTVPGSIIRLEVNSIPFLDAAVDDAAIFVLVGGGTQNPAYSPGLTLSASGGVGGVLASDGSNRGYVSTTPITVGAGGATFAGTTGTTLTVTADVNAAGNPVTINSTSLIDGLAKAGNVTFANPFAAGSLTLANAGVARFNHIFAVTGDIIANLAAGSVVSLNSANSSAGGNIRIGGVGSVLFLGGGGTSDQQGNLGPRLTDTTGLVANRVADTIYIDDGARVEFGLRDDTTPKNPEGRIEVTQPFVITGDVNPASKRSFWISRRQGSVVLPVTLMDVTVMPGGVFAVQENNTDVWAYLKLNGDATVTQFDEIRFADITNVTSPTPITLTWGRVGDTAAACDIVDLLAILQTNPDVNLNIVNGLFRLRTPDLAEGSPIVNVLDAALNITPGAALTLASARDGTDMAVNGYSRFGNVILGEGAIVNLQENDLVNLIADFVLAGNATVNSTDNGTLVHMGDITGTGSQVLTFGGTQRTRFYGALSGADIIITNTSSTELRENPADLGGGAGFTLGGRTVDIQSTGWIDVYADPGAGTLKASMANAKIAIYRGQDGVEPGLTSATNIVLSDGGLLRAQVAEVAAGEPQVVNNVAAAVRIEATGGTLEANRANDAALDGFAYFSNVTVADGAAFKMNRVNGACAAALTLEGNASVANSGTGTTIFVTDVTGTGTSVLTVTAGQGVNLVGTLTGTDIVVNNPTLGVFLFDMTPSTLNTAFALNGRTIDVQAGTLQVGGSRGAWGSMTFPNQNLDPGSGIINLTRGAGDPNAGGKLDIYSGQDGAMGAWGAGLVVNVNPEGTTPTLSSL
ncbi:MAG: autotransporter-associated beta strand repeat-containing protein, partial [Planctomycetes bacterium]|nr:autotransporter-associated beta strand repeat-containing protein [Planctomycetota bacterium]